MKNKFLLLIICLTFYSCTQTEKSNEVTKKALDIYLSSELDEEVRIDSSLFLINKALDLDHENTQALNHKITLLFRKKDINGLLQTTDQLININPGKPFYMGQKAIFLELKGDSTRADKYYKKALSTYEKLLEKDKTDFDLMMEYVSIIEASGDTALANKTLITMEKLGFEEYQKEMIDLYRKQSITKKQMVRYWTGEIGYNQIEVE